MLNEVGHHLQVAAGARPMQERDWFARSAFNRYYYANFIEARAVRQRLLETQENIGHAQYPEFLRGNLKKKFQQEKRQASRSKDFELYREIERAINACNDLAIQFERANNIRKVADYEPDIKVEFSKSGGFSLNKVAITDAHQWLQKTNNMLSIIENTWKRINV